MSVKKQNIIVYLISKDVVAQKLQNAFDQPVTVNDIINIKISETDPTFVEVTLVTSTTILQP